MTAQTPERLLYEGQEVPLCTEPLEDFFALTGDRPQLQIASTALWRCYEGSWEITDGRLYLIGIEGTLINGQPLTLQAIFPGCGERVFAHWYRGEMRVPRGPRLHYVHGGYGSTYAYDLLITVEAGVVVKTRLRKNTPPQADRDDLEAAS
jgi:hypothetical protein